MESGSRRRAEAALWRAAQAGGLPHSKALPRPSKHAPIHGHTTRCDSTKSLQKTE